MSIVLKQWLRRAYWKMFSVCLTDAAACILEIKSSDPLHSYISVCSEEPYDCILDMSSAVCDYSCQWPVTWQLNQVRSSSVQRKKNPFSLTPMYLWLISKDGRVVTKKTWDILVDISPTGRIWFSDGMGGYQSTCAISVGLDPAL